MCGIAGLLRTDLPQGAREESVARMLQTLRHRGPDGQATWDGEGACLGHARLAIIDLETGDQPHFDSGRDVVAVVNGEIYNHGDLRLALEAKGHVFRTRSDTEVVPHLYAEHGDAFVDHLRGMFAIALFDRKRERLLLARDRLGQKPLYWTRTGEGVAFASELRALGTLPGVTFRADPEALDLLLSYQYVPAPWSIVAGVRKLPAATLLVAEQGRTRARRYWQDLPDPDEALRGKPLQDRLAPLIEEATRVRLASDVPLGLFLSGGIDSGLVAAGPRPTPCTTRCTWASTGPWVTSRTWRGRRRSTSACRSGWSGCPQTPRR